MQLNEPKLRNREADVLRADGLTAFPTEVEAKLHLFLEQFCPNPKAIRDALDRTRLGTVHDFLSGESICKRGERVQGCWLVVSGQVEVRADEQIVAFRGPGEMFGEQGL